jgi:two-component system nitrogen regulation sensor histidine kinase GlnL
VVLTADRVVVALNPAAEALLDVSAAVAVGSAIETTLPPGEESAWLGELVTKTLSDGRVHRHGDGTWTIHGRTTPISGVCAPVHDTRGTVWGAALVLHDLTLERRLDEANRRADRLSALGSVILGLAHEIRNPLGGIKGAAQLLGGADDPDQRRCLDIIVREVERLNRLVSQLTVIGDPPPVSRRPVNIHRVLNDVVTLERETPAWGTIRLRTVFDPSLPPVLGDPDRLTQLFLNLIRNAVEAANGRGEIHVTTGLETGLHVRRPDGWARLLAVTVEDDGPGIPPDIEARIFAPLFSTKARGTGFGLSVCQQIAGEHEGTIDYEARPGGGTIFRVRLPLAEADERGTDD